MSSMPLGWNTLAMATCVLLAWSRQAEACSYAPIPVHQVDPALAQQDQAAPSVPIVTTTDNSRRLGTDCSGGSCTESSCGDTAQVTIEFAASTDDSTDASAIGYGLRVVSGTLPGYTNGVPAQTLGGLEDGSGTLWLRMSFDAIAELEAVVVLQAVDAAGNVSESEPFELVFSDCTYALFGEACMSSGEPAPNGQPAVTETTAGEPGSSNLNPVNGTSASGCATAPARHANGAGAVGLAVTALFGWRRRPRR